jgi:hypothetical protein
MVDDAIMAKKELLVFTSSFWVNFMKFNNYTNSFLKALTIVEPISAGEVTT